jgi:ketosteroid isomerase-like protein
MATSEQDRQQIAAVIEQYRRAFIEIDMEVFKATWDQDYNNIIYVPQERAQPVRGWTELERYFDSVEGAFKRVTTMKISDVSVDVLGDVAYAFFTYHFEAEAKDRNEPFIVDGRNTLILHRKTGTWKVIHYHGSPPGPY